MRKLALLAPVILAGLIAGCGATAPTTQRLPYVTPPPVVRATPTPANTGSTLNMAAAKATMDNATSQYEDQMAQLTAETQTWTATTPIATEHAAFAKMDNALLTLNTTYEGVLPEVTPAARLAIENYLAALQPMEGYLGAFQRDSNTQIMAGMPAYLRAAAKVVQVEQAIPPTFQGVN